MPAAERWGDTAWREHQSNETYHRLCADPRGALPQALTEAVRACEHGSVAEAQRTAQGIALEDLGGIRERARLRKPQRVTLHSWSFRQLGTFIAYKAQRAGVPLMHVDPAYTSQECSQCHHIDRRNRPVDRSVR